jgi:hypothetical protein
MNEKIINEILEKQKDLVVKSQKEGYTRALSDMWSELQIRQLDGFIINETMIREVVEMLLEKQ